MESMTLPVVQVPLLSHNDLGLESGSAVPPTEKPKHEGQVVLAAGLALAAYSLVYLFALAIAFES